MRWACLIRLSPLLLHLGVPCELLSCSTWPVFALNVQRPHCTASSEGVEQSHMSFTMCPAVIFDIEASEIESDPYRDELAAAAPKEAVLVLASIAHETACMLCRWSEMRSTGLFTNAHPVCQAVPWLLRTQSFLQGRPRCQRGRHAIKASSMSPAQCSCSRSAIPGVQHKTFGTHALPQETMRHRLRPARHPGTGCRSWSCSLRCAGCESEWVRAH